MKKNLVITNIFCHSLGASLYKGSTVLNFIYLFFKKSGEGAWPPSSSPCAGPDAPVPPISPITYPEQASECSFSCILDFSLPKIQLYVETRRCIIQSTITHFSA